MSFESVSEVLRERIFSDAQPAAMPLALDVFSFQYQYNRVYRSYCDILGKNPTNVHTIGEIPFLPIGQFKQQRIQTGDFVPEIIFESSGTTGSVNSIHAVKDLTLYEQSFSKAFRLQYGNPSEYCIIGLLPSYLERKHSSLVHMVDRLIRDSGHPLSGFYLYDHEKLHQTIAANESNGVTSILIGVTYALLDFSESHRMQLKHTIVMETGGMKGRKRELTREEVHGLLCERLGIDAVHSEYGMTELLSQAYSGGLGRFTSPPWMKVLIRADDDPFEIMPYPPGGNTSITGVINIIDLANLYSCSFIATDDLGRLHSDGRFEVLGRLDNSDIRGCSLMLG